LLGRGIVVVGSVEKRRKEEARPNRWTAVSKGGYLIIRGGGKKGKKSLSLPRGNKDHAETMWGGTLEPKVSLKKKGGIYRMYYERKGGFFTHLTQTSLEFLTRTKGVPINRWGEKVWGLP